jgi:hypothetical protein
VYRNFSIYAGPRPILEEIRPVFLADHPGLRVDGGRLLIVIAVADEEALEVLLPADY